MIATVEIKDSGIEWVKDIPAHWNVLPLFGMFYEKQIKNSEGIENNVLSLSYGKIIRRNVEDNFGLLPESFNTYQIVGNGDIIMRLTDLQNDKRSLRVGLVKEKGIITSAYLCLSLLKSQIVNNIEYFYYLLHTYDKYKIYYNLGGGVRQSMGFADLKRMPLIMPPKEEQDEIVQYIKAQEEKINLFIQKKKRFIELLKEQRQSKIDEAVIRGINLNVKFKNTKYDWLGAIPEHWQIRRLGTIGSFSKGGNISRAELVENGIPAILYGDIYTKYDIEAKSIINRIEEETAANSIKIEKGDLLFTGSGETKEDIGKCIVYNGDDEVYVGGDVIIFKQNEFDSHFISYSQNSSLTKYQKAVSSKGDIIVHTYGSKLRNVVMPYPPTIEEQKQIVSHIKTETATIDTAIAKAEREIELIREYKESMIAEAVMGKRKINFAH